MRRFLLTLMAFCICIVTNAQSNSQTGYYYNLSGQKISGIITFQPGENYIRIRTDENAKNEKVDIKEISSLVVNYGGMRSDSLIVLTKNNDEKNRYFAKSYFVTPAVNFYYRYKMLHSGGTDVTTIMRGSSTSNALTTTTRVTNMPVTSYQVESIMYQEGNTTYELTRGNYIEILSKAFANDRKLVARIKNKEFGFKHLEQIFKQYRHDIFNTGAETIELDSSGLLK